jgi:hypothetical protein
LDISKLTSSAKDLSRNPLGIIALFIVLIYGFAALTLGINSLQEHERLPLVWFLVLFPLVVLFVFGWLVSCHHEKLYAPADYKSDEGFLSGILARTRHAAEIQDQQDQLKSKIREAVVAAKKDKPYEAESLVNELTKEIDQATTITIDAQDFLKDKSATFSFPIAVFENFSDLTNAVYFKLTPAVSPFSYGYSWVLRNRSTGEIVRNSRMITKTPPGKPLTDCRSLSEVGIKPGVQLRVELPQESI